MSEYCNECQSEICETSMKCDACGWIVDRCCAECGEHFDGCKMDDYCSDCFDELNLGAYNV